MLTKTDLYIATVYQEDAANFAANARLNMGLTGSLKVNSNTGAVYCQKLAAQYYAQVREMLGITE